jgi:hypothetical protein
MQIFCKCSANHAAAAARTNKPGNWAWAVISAAV